MRVGAELQDALQAFLAEAHLGPGASGAALLAQWRAERDAQSVSAHAIESFLDQTVRNMTIVRSGLAEVLLVQGSQEIAGQVVRSVMNLLDEWDAAIATLARLAGAPAMERAPAAAPAYGHCKRTTRPAAGDVADVNAWLLKSGS